jgi:hypothetical protein
VTWLLRIIGGAAGPYVVGVVAAGLLALGATMLWQRVTIAELRTDVASCAGDVTKLKGALELQNREVERRAAACAAESQAAALAAVRALTAPPVVPPPGSGPAEMNRWFAQRLASR